MAEKVLNNRRKGSEFLQLSVVLLVLFLTTFYSFTLFHALAEITWIVIAFSVFIIAWNARDYIDNHYFLFIGIALFFTSIFNLLHTISYKDFSVFSSNSENLSFQLWTAGRYLTGLSFLIAPTFIKRKMNSQLVFTAYLTVSLLLLLIIFIYPFFPNVVGEMGQFTFFKKFSGIAIAVMNSGALFFLYARRREFNRKVFWLLSGALVSLIIAEIFSFIGTGVERYHDLIGLVFRIVAAYLIYLGIISISLMKPYELLFKRFKDAKEKELAGSEERYRELWNNAPVAYHTLDAQGLITSVNKTEAEMLGYDVCEMIGRPIFDFIEPNQKENAIKRFLLKLSGEKISQKEDRIYVKNDGSKIYVSITDALEKNERGEIIGMRTTMTDVTELKQIEKQRDAANKLLQLLVSSSSRKKYLNEVVKLLHDWSGCKYAGIRILNESGNIPYEAYVNFSQEFWESENWLSLKTDQCACVRVVAQKPEPQDMPAMTAGGSFRCDNTFDFVNSLTDEEKSRFRGVCVTSGFKSVAVIPIRYMKKMFGAIHLADEREEMVPQKNIEFIEKMSSMIGEAIYRYSTEDSLRISREHEAELTAINEKLHNEIQKRKKAEEELRNLTRELEVRVEERTKELEEVNEHLRAEIAERLKAEQKVFESYKYLGTINRQIAIIAELNKNNVVTSEQEIIKYILESAVKLSQAKVCALYDYNVVNNVLNLKSVVGLEEEHNAGMKTLSASESDALKNLIEKNTRIQGNFQEYDPGKLGSTAHLDYFIMLPLVNSKNFRGALFLGFYGRSNIMTQELDFYEVFAAQTSLVLSQFNVIK